MSFHSCLGLRSIIFLDLLPALKHIHIKRKENHRSNPLTNSGFETHQVTTEFSRFFLQKKFTPKLVQRSLEKKSLKLFNQKLCKFSIKTPLAKISTSWRKIPMQIVIKLVIHPFLLLHPFPRENLLVEIFAQEISVHWCHGRGIFLLWLTKGRSFQQNLSIARIRKIEKLTTIRI